MLDRLVVFDSAELNSAKRIVAIPQLFAELAVDETMAEYPVSFTTQTKRDSYQQWKQELGSGQSTTAPPKDRQGVWLLRQGKVVQWQTL